MALKRTVEAGAVVELRVPGDDARIHVEMPDGSLLSAPVDGRTYRLWVPQAGAWRYHFSFGSGRLTDDEELTVVEPAEAAAEHERAFEGMMVVSRVVR